MLSVPDRRAPARAGSSTPPPRGRSARVPTRPALVLTAAATCLAIVLAVSAFAPGAVPGGHARIALYLDGVAIDAAGELVAIPAGAGATYLPGSRVVDAAAAHRAEADRAWLAAGRIPGIDGPYADVVAGALLDLRALTDDSGALLAAHSPRWRYVWPRDASFAAAALAVAGHAEDARRILVHLQQLHAVSGRFEARYLPDGSGRVPDDRRAQSDGAGWALWAVGVLLDHLPERDRRATATDLAPLTDAATTFIGGQTATASGLPRASADYWETRSDVLTLGTAAPLLAGLESAAGIYTVLGRPADAAAARSDAVRLRTVVESVFGSRDYPRSLRDRHHDAAVAFLLPPFQGSALAGAQDAWWRSIPAMTRPAGGLAPGGSWRQDGISWTPQTALYALAAASTGRPGLAERWLAWLAEHRTASGAIPEKVLADGSPAAVAPLAWTCALVVLAVAALDDSRNHPGAAALLAETA